MGHGWMIDNFGWDWWGHGLFGSPMMFIFWALIVVAMVLVVRGVIGRPSNRNSRDNDSPEEILRHRYASGQITKDQFDSMSQDLT